MQANEAAHHVVAGKDPRAAAARARLESEGIPINAAANGVGLPRNLKSPNPAGKAVHSTVHTNRYYIALDRAIANAPPGAAKEALRDIARRLEAGTWP